MPLATPLEVSLFGLVSYPVPETAPAGQKQPGEPFGEASPLHKAQSQLLSSVSLPSSALQHGQVLCGGISG